MAFTAGSVPDIRIAVSSAILGVKIFFFVFHLTLKYLWFESNQLLFKESRKMHLRHWCGK